MQDFKIRWSRIRWYRIRWYLPLAILRLRDWFWAESLVGKILKLDEIELDDIGLDDILNGNSN